MPFIAFSEDVASYWRCYFIRDWCLFISSLFKTLHISWAAADLQTLEFLIFVFVVFIALGFFHHSPHQTLSQAA